MSVECSECEWDARAGHDPDCSRSAEHQLQILRKAVVTSLVSLQTSNAFCNCNSWLSRWLDSYES